MGWPRRRAVRLGLAPRRRRTAARRSHAAALAPVGPRRRVAGRRPTGPAERPGLLRRARDARRRRRCRPPARWAIQRTVRGRGWRAVGEIAGAASAAQPRALARLWTARARPPRRQAPPRRATARAGGIRAAAVGQ